MLSIIIKTLNEEQKIAFAIESAIAAADECAIPYEIVLADCISSDRTLEIARQYPITIVQLTEVAHRGCGAAAQLGYQYAGGEYLYMLDGDMTIEPGFLSAALTLMQGDPLLAGIGGKLLDSQIKTSYDAKRAQHAAGLMSNRPVDELGGGGLYRRKAIETVGYLAHRWLPAYEEAELGARLRAQGWKLLRMARIAVRHTGHDESNIEMMCRLWRNRRVHAHGMLLRASFLKPWRGQIWKKFWFVLAVPAIHLLGVSLGLGLIAAGMATSWLLPCGCDLAAWLTVILVLAVIKRGISKGCYSVMIWHWAAGASICGVMTAVPDPHIPIPGRVIVEHITT